MVATVRIGHQGAFAGVIDDCGKQGVFARPTGHAQHPGGERKQHERQSGQDADLGLRQMQIVVDQPDHRRDGQDGQPQADAGKP